MFYQQVIYNIMSPYPSLETSDNHRLQHIADVKVNLEKERDIRALLHKNNKQGQVNIVNGADTALLAVSVSKANVNYYLNAYCYWHTNRCGCVWLAKSQQNAYRWETLGEG